MAEKETDVTAQSGPQDSIEHLNRLRLRDAAVANIGGNQALAEKLSLEIIQDTPDSAKTSLVYARACSLMAAIRMDQSRTIEALEFSTKAFSASPDDATVTSNYADILNRCSNYDEALRISDTAIQLAPNLAEPHINRGTALVGLYRFAEARKEYELALELKPELKHVVYGNLILLHGKEGQYETARKFGDVAASESPENYDIARNRQSYSMYTPSFTRCDERDITQALWKVTPAPQERLKWSSEPNLEKGRRLRLGYFSADFKSHPVSLFLKPVLERHDRSNFQIFMYDVTPKPDDASHVMQAFADNYHNGVGQSDEELAQKIAADKIDILVDLTGVFENNRLNVFRYKPAPIQMMWIGYSGTSGLSEMDYVIADEHVCPLGVEADFTESIIRLPRHYLCYDAPKIAVTARNPFALPNPGITFGNFNNHMKLNSDVIRLWSEIVKRVPGSLLFLKTPGFDDVHLRRHVRRQFEARGVDSQQLKLAGRVSPEAHMNAYNDVDIALDPFPYCGTTTTVEALSMGVPVVTLLGERWVQRTSHGFLKGMGWDELSAFSESEYADIAINLAKDPPKVRAMKAIGRKKFLASSVCDTERLTRDVEAAYREVWQRYCQDNLTAH